MISLIKKYINKLSEEQNLSDEDIQLYLVFIVSTFFAGIMHVVLLFVMAVIGLPFLAAVNVGSIGVYASSLIWLIKKKQYTPAGIVIAGEVVCYILVVSIYIGTVHYVILYYFVVLFMQLTIRYSGVRTRILVSVVIWLSMTASLLLGAYHAPMQEAIAPNGHMLLIMANVNLAFGGVVLLLTTSNMIRAIIAQTNTMRLEQYKNQAHTDSLTGLYNRRYAKDIFFGMMVKETERPWCVAMLDIDDFKTINDTLGHLAGDEVLRNLSGVLRKNLRKTDALFRWGGEEFLLFLSDVELESAVRILEKILRQVAATPIPYGHSTIRMTVTAGVSAVNLGDVEGSIELCDKWLYDGKNSGKNKVVFCDAV